MALTIGNRKGEAIMKGDLYKLRRQGSSHHHLLLKNNQLFKK